MVLIYLPPTGQGLGCVVLFPKGPRSHLGACQVPHASPLLWEHGGHQLLLADPQVGLDPHQLKGPRELVPLEQVPCEQELLFSFLITGFDFFSFLITDFGLASILKAGFSCLTNLRFLVVILRLPSTLITTFE